MAANLDILIRAQNQASSALRAVGGDLDTLSRKASGASRGFSSLQTAMGAGLKVAGGLALAGVAALGAGFGAATVDGFRLNSSLENVTAQLFAFTKDGEEAESILADIREEAAKTPFAFDEMARATASLLPAAKQSGVALMDLVGTAEILAASNPAQGLEGAAFSIREALSGDFVSIVERFNLPRQRLNQLKEEGVPAMEAITIAMREMGLDADLVSNMALTMTGRWSTFKDTMDTVKAALAKPLFDLVKKGLSDLQPVLDAAMPRMMELATVIGERMASAVDALISRGLPALVSGFKNLSTAAFQLVDFLRPVGESIMAMIAPVLQAVGSFVSWKDVLGAVGIVVASVVIPALVGIVAAAAPVVVVAAALVAGVAVLRNAWEQDWGGIQGKTADAVAVIAPIFEKIVSWLATKIPAALSAMSDFFGPAIERIVEAFQPMLESMAPLSEKFAELAAVALPVLEAIGTAVVTVAAFLLDVFLNTVAEVMPQVGTIIGAMVDQATAMFTFLSDAFSTTVALFTAIVDGDWALAWTTAGSLLDTFSTYFQSIFNNMLTIGRTIITSIKDAIVNTLTDMGVDVEPIFATITTLWESATNAWNSAIGGVTGAINAITSGIQSAKDAMQNFVNWLGNISVPNPFAGLSLPSLPAWAGGGNAAGTPYFRGGLTVVGERGPELVALPRGSRIHNAEDTARMGSNTINVIVNAAVGDGVDAEALAYRIAGIIQRRQRAGAYA